jgi:hypothetical protein
MIMKYGKIGDKKMSLMPKWLDEILNILFVLFIFVMVFTIIWVFYVLLQITHI